jgi:hypothetical protein
VASTANLSSLYITYTPAAARRSYFTLQRQLVGRRTTPACVAANARNRQFPRCIRLALVASFSHADTVRATRLRLMYYVPWRRLVPGLYRLRTVMFDAAGRRHTFGTTFRVTR